MFHVSRFHVSRGRRALLAVAVLLAIPDASLAGPKAGACTAGQAELKPLQPLTLVTDKGRFNLKVEVADTSQSRETGLMCRTRLAPDGGMLFDFKRPTDGVGFWMHNTLIPLDIIFIRFDGHIARIAANAAPEDLSLIESGEPVAAVLEIAGGGAAAAGITEGDVVRWPGAPAS